MITTDFQEDLLAMRCPYTWAMRQDYILPLSILSICEWFHTILKGMNGAILAYGQTASGSGLRRVPA